MKETFQWVAVAAFCALIFGPWAIGLVDLGAWALLGQQVTDIPWRESRGAVLFLWPIGGFVVFAVVSSFFYG